jgi:serine/threonine protein kinase
LESIARAYNGPDHAAIACFIEQQILSGNRALAAGSQSRIYVYVDPGGRYAIKIPRGNPLLGWVERCIIRRERSIYARLEGLPGIPRCHGLIAGRYLVLDYVEGESFRAAQARLDPAHPFFEQLREIIEAIHARGVAHTDLKRKDNLLVQTGDTPCIVDFGAAMVRGGNPLSHGLFRIARQFDRNAWIKLKYDGYRNIAAEDRTHLRRLGIERVSHWIKRRLRHLRRALSNKKERSR